jgi:hypothetical protein
MTSRAAPRPTLCHCCFTARAVGVSRQHKQPRPLPSCWSAMKLIRLAALFNKQSLPPFLPSCLPSRAAFLCWRRRAAS